MTPAIIAAALLALVYLAWTTPDTEVCPGCGSDNITLIGGAGECWSCSHTWEAEL